MLHFIQDMCLHVLSATCPVILCLVSFSLLQIIITIGSVVLENSLSRAKLSKIECHFYKDIYILGCQPLLGVNLSPEFVNLYFPYAGQGLLVFSLVAAAF